MDDLFSVFFFLFFLLFFFVIFGAVFQSLRNKKAPKVQVKVKCVSKRVSRSKNSTHYYIKFLFPLGDEAEFSVTRTEYNSILEGDCDYLIFKGTQFISFGPESSENSFSSKYELPQSSTDDYTFDVNEDDNEKPKSNKNSIEDELDDKFDDYFDNDRY